MTSKLRIAALALAVLTGTTGYAAAQDYRYESGYNNRGYDRDDDRYDNFRRSIVFFSRTYCRICATKHEWFAREAWVYESVFANDPCGGGRSPGGGAA